MSFSGFDRSAIELLRKLPDFDAKAYAAEKARLKQGVTDPGAELIESLAAVLPVPLTVQRRSSVSPLHRDLRFAEPGAPRYKDHLLLTAWSGEHKKTAPILWLRIDAESVGFATGMGFDGPLRERWRSAVGNKSGEALSKAISRVQSKHRKHFCEVDGDVLKKVPAPWPAEHPRGELLRMNAFQLRFKEALPGGVEKPAFVKWCASRFEGLLPVHEWLCEHIAGKPAP